MTKEELLAWRVRNGLTRAELAVRLGMSETWVQDLEKGSRAGRTYTIPAWLPLALFALEQGVGDYDGLPIPYLSKQPSEPRKKRGNRIGNLFTRPPRAGKQDEAAEQERALPARKGRPRVGRKP